MVKKSKLPSACSWTSSDDDTSDDEKMPRFMVDFSKSLKEPKKPADQFAFPVLVPRPDESFALEEDVSGLLVLDCGATSNLVGSDTVDRMQEKALEENRSTGLSFSNEERREFRFGNDQTKPANGVCTKTAHIVGTPMLYHSHVVPGGAPWLASVDFLRSSGAVVDFGRDKAVFANLAPDKMVQLRRLSTGHLAIPLNEEETGSLPSTSTDPVLSRWLQAHK